VQRSELHELCYITPIANVPSILRVGIVSHRRSLEINHVSVAMQEMQDRRSRVAVPPGGKKLHDYANLYICARNPMLCKRQNQHADLCVLSIQTGVLDLPGIVITDCNASSEYVRFAAAPEGLSIVDRDMTFADDWNDPNRIQYFRKKSAKCAEVLVPDCVPPEFITGAYVSCREALNRLSALNTRISVTINGHLFFR